LKRIPIASYFILAFLTVSTIGLSTLSLGFLNYPTQVMFKCCKLIPVLIGGILIQGKTFNIYDISACVLMSFGLIFFTLADVKVQPSFDITGVLLISGALLADATIGNYQEKQMKLHKADNSEVIFYSYAIGFFYILFGIICFGSLNEYLNFWLQVKPTFIKEN
jgi:solute carrier family 35 (adenosine 3'-phospho 5'-phosphosulfate transporter), member B3